MCEVQVIGSKYMDVISDKTDVLKILPEAAVELCTALFRNSPAGIYITRDGKFIYTNIEFRLITGYSQNELSGKDYQRLINLRYRHMPKQNVASLFEEENASHEFKITTHDGKKKWVSEKITYFKYGGNWLTLGHWLDITDHHNVEKAWREAERRFQSAFEDLSTGLTIISTDSIFLKVNKAFCDMLGYDEKEILESRFDDVLWPDDRSASGDIMALFLSLGKPDEPLQLRLRHKGSMMLWAAMSISLIGDSEAGPSYFIVHFQDITEQKRIEEGLKEEERLYRSLVDLSLEPIAVADLDCHLTHVSRRFVNLLGYKDASDLLGKTIGSLAVRADSDSIQTQIMEVLKQGISGSIECSLVKQDGAELPVNMNISWINSNNGAIQCIVIGLHATASEKTIKEAAADTIVEASAPSSEISLKETATEATPPPVQETPAAGTIVETPPSVMPALESLSTAIILINPDTIITAVNAAFEKLSGYPRSEIEGKKSWIEFVAKDDQARLKRYYLIRRLDPDSAPDTYEFKFVGRDGNTKDVVIYISQLPGTNQQEATLLELAGYKKAVNTEPSFGQLQEEPGQKEQTLDDTEDRLADILKSSPDVIIVTDMDGVITFASQNVIDILADGNPREVLGRDYRLLIRPGMVEDANKLFEEIKLAGTVRDREFDFVRHNGKIIKGDVSASLIKDESGQPSGIIYITRDIVQRRKVQKAEEKLRESLAQLERTVQGTIEAMDKIVDMRDPYTSGHQDRVAALARAIAVEMNLSEEQVHGIEVAAKIHDIGKVYVPMEMLSKPGPLISIERSIIQAHAQGSWDILKSIEFPWPVAETVYQHHERLDGSGYPRSLRDSELILEAKILMVADVVEAMASHRPYRTSLGIEAALDEISTNSGILYDPTVVSACIRLFREKGFSFEGSVSV